MSNTTLSATKPSGRRKRPDLRLVTYNILSSTLASPSHFISCDPEYCKTEYRLEKILQFMREEIDNKAIICLQEVSHKFANELHTFFANNDYYFVHALYGNRFNNYMGVGIAVPLARYNIDEVNITRIADTKSTPKKEWPSFFMSIWLAVCGIVLRFLEYVKLYQKPFDVWDNALYRSNQMLCLRLSCKKKGAESTPFVVGTYHMPCMFKHPSVMNIHCALSAQHIAKFAGNDPYIYAGDFNIKPDSSMYELLTKGSIPNGHPEKPEQISSDDAWKLEVSPLESAYKEYQGQEPDFTNYAHVKGCPIFQETLDYIFLSRNQEDGDSDWMVNAVKKLPHRTQVFDGPYPNKGEPSDHLLLAADLVMK